MCNADDMEGEFAPRMYSVSVGTLMNMYSVFIGGCATRMNDGECTTRMDVGECAHRMYSVSVLVRL